MPLLANPTWLKRQLENERSVRAMLERALERTKDDFTRMLRMNDELVSELNRKRLEVEELHVKLATKGRK